MLVGFLLAARLPAWVTTFLLIAAEVLLLALIRDNLTLNVIMLIHPVEWIKEWQHGWMSWPGADCSQVTGPSLPRAA